MLSVLRSAKASYDQTWTPGRFSSGVVGGGGHRARLDLLGGTACDVHPKPFPGVVLRHPRFEVVRLKPDHRGCRGPSVNLA